MNIREQVQIRYQVHDIVHDKNYGVEYQPIISMRTGEIVAYEALARFYLPDGTKLSPETVFNILHEDIELLCQTELELKQLQIDNAPDDYDLFINIDPHAISPISDIETDPLINLLTGNQRIVVELIENIDIHDAMACTVLHTTLKRRGIRSALDDIGAPHAMTSLQLMMLVDFLKFDRIWLANLDKDKHYRLFESLVGFANNCDKPTILEGIESQDMLNTSRNLSISQGQGFLYKPIFKSVRA